MSMAIKTPPLLPFNRTISDDKIERAITSDNRADAVALTLWDKIKDWFCGTKTSEVLERIFVLTHVDEKVNTERALSTILAFNQLRDMAYPIQFDKFRAAVTSEKEGQYTFSFSITDMMDERSVSYGTHQDDVNVIRRQLLTNAGEFLSSDFVGDRHIGAALAEVTYDSSRKVLTGVSKANQNRLFLDLLSDATKDAMAMRPKLAQEWLAVQMKSFDYFARLRSSLETEANMSEIGLEEAEESCILSFGRSIDALHKNRIEMLAAEFNEKYQGSIEQGVYSGRKRVRFDPVTTGPAAVEPIYTEPAYAEVAATKPAKAEPLYAKPLFAEAAATKPAKAEPPYAEPFFAEAAATKPAKAEPPYAEPFFAEAAATKPAKAEPPYAEPFFAEAVATKPAKAELPFAEPVNSHSLYTKPARAGSVIAKESSAKAAYDEPIYAEPVFIDRNSNEFPHAGSPYDKRLEAIDKITSRTREEENNHRTNSAAHLDDSINQTAIQTAHYYQGPLNGDIYAKTEKPHIGLLEEIVSDVRMNEEKYPLLAEYFRKYNFL